MPDGERAFPLALEGSEPGKAASALGDQGVLGPAGVLALHFPTTEKPGRGLGHRVGGPGQDSCQGALGPCCSSPGGRLQPILSALTLFTALSPGFALLQGRGLAGATGHSLPGVPAPGRGEGKSGCLPAGLFRVPAPAAIPDRNLPVWSALQLAFRVQLSGSCLTPVGAGASSVSGPTGGRRGAALASSLGSASHPVPLGSASLPGPRFPHL